MNTKQRNKEDKNFRSFYGSVHVWLRHKYGAATHCENKECPGVSTNYQWAKLSGVEYDYKRENFIQLCRSCHAKYDSTEKSKQKLRDYRLSKFTHCPQGHPLSGDNLYSPPKSPNHRGCKKCRVLTNKRWKQRQKHGVDLSE